MKNKIIFYLFITGASSSKYKIVQLKPVFIEKRNISFGGDEEEEMIQKFNFFNIIWYAPENSEKLEEWRAFTNVKVIKITEEEEFIEISKRINAEIIITTGSYAEKTFPKLSNMSELFSTILIYCMDVDYHQKWSKEYKYVAGVFAHPSQIFKFLLEFQKNNTIEMPLFKYKFISYKEFNFNLYLSFNNKEKFIEKSNFSLRLNKYEKICLTNSLHFIQIQKNLDYDAYLDNFFSDSEINQIFYDCNQGYRENRYNFTSFFCGLTIISLYFSKFPYLYGYLNYEEVLNLLNEDVTTKDLREDYIMLAKIHIPAIGDKLVKEEVFILEENTHLKFFHSFLIKFIKFYSTTLLSEFKFQNFNRFPTMIKYLMDIDFCLKYFSAYIYGHYNMSLNIKINMSLREIDKRIITYEAYFGLNFYKNFALKYINEEELSTLSENLKIVDFIVIGDKTFQQIIKDIESYFIHKKIPYLTIFEVRQYIISRKDDRYRTFSYFFIIDIKEAQNINKELCTLRDEFSLSLILIIYNKDSKFLINKEPFKEALLPIFIANNINEIINYINCQEFFNCGFCFENQSSNITNRIQNILDQNLKIPKIKMEDENKNKDKDTRLFSEDGWELVDKVPETIFKNLILRKIGSNLFCSDSIAINMFNLYKENKLEYLFYNTYCKYLGFRLIPELNIEIFALMIKRFLYAYTLHEDKNSFYYLMNKDLRSGEPLKINKYLEIISAINFLLEDEEIKYFKSYEGNLFRATKMEKKYIEEKLIVGKVLTNLSFWSASKNKKVAESFLADKEKNIMFLIKTKKKILILTMNKFQKIQMKR